MRNMFKSVRLLIRLFFHFYRCNFNLTHYHIKHHHQYEANGKADGAEIGVLTAGGFWDQFLDHDVEHGSRGKSEQVGKGGHQ